MSLFHIVATSLNGVIGVNNRLPWCAPEDLKRFKQTTMGSTVIMGRKTFESIGKPLPGRENFVLSHTAHKTRTFETVRFFRDAVEALKNVETEKAFVIGGGSLYEQTLDRVDGIYLTLVEGNYEGDVYYPLRHIGDFSKAGFEKISEESPPGDERLTFYFFKRISV